MVRTRDELAAADDANPYPAATAEPKTLHVVFLSDVPSRHLGPGRPGLRGVRAGRVPAHRREIYLFLPGGLGRSKLAAKLATPGSG